jgi:hypothetical protein
MQIVPLDPVLYFDILLAILKWLLSAAQPKLQHPRHKYSIYLDSLTGIEAGDAGASAFRHPGPELRGEYAATE